MIPKIIHYCWFGTMEKPSQVCRYIRTWEKHFPNWKIIEWSEENVNIDLLPRYAQEAYKCKKYAFVSDYVRLWALNTYGGLYLDTDVEVLRNFESKLSNASIVVCFEHPHGLSTGIIAAEPRQQCLEKFMETYQTRNFIFEDGTFDLTTINDGFNFVMQEQGVDLSFEREQKLDNGIQVYTSDVFSAFDMKHWHENVTSSTYSVHHMAGTWFDKKKCIKNYLIMLCRRTLGIRITDKIQDWIRKG